MHSSSTCESVFLDETQPACGGTLSAVIVRRCSLHTLPAPSWIIHPFGWSNTHLLFILPPWCQASRAATALWNLKGALLWARACRFSWLTVCNTLQQWPLWGDLHKLKRSLASQCSSKKWAPLKEKMSLNPNRDFHPFSNYFMMLAVFLSLGSAVTFWRRQQFHLHLEHVCWHESKTYCLI